MKKGWVEVGKVALNSTVFKFLALNLLALHYYLSLRMHFIYSFSLSFFILLFFVVSAGTLGLYSGYAVLCCAVSCCAVSCGVYALLRCEM